MSAIWACTPIVIVSFRTPVNVASCLQSLDALQADNDFSIHICENGGETAYAELAGALLGEAGPCVACPAVSFPVAHRFRRMTRLRLRHSSRLVMVGEAPENLGYSGGINIWLDPLLTLPGWQGCWILNPDTSVHPAALTCLSADAAKHRLGIVGSKILYGPTDDRIGNGGLRWRRLLAMPESVLRNASAATSYDPELINSILDAPSGASCYFTRSCAQALAPFDERYFLLFEDLDWGMRAKKLGYRLGLAQDAITYHSGGTSIDLSPSKWSPLRSYLGFRNSLVFVRGHHPRWLAWTVFAGLVNALRLCRRISLWHAMRGLAAGLRGETGRPEWLLRQHDIRPEVARTPTVSK